MGAVLTDGGWETGDREERVPFVHHYREEAEKVFVNPTWGPPERKPLQRIGWFA
jgi:hypothetical protein